MKDRGGPCRYVWNGVPRAVSILLPAFPYVPQHPCCFACPAEGCTWKPLRRDLEVRALARVEGEVALNYPHGPTEDFCCQG